MTDMKSLISQTYQKLTKSFLNSGGIIIRGEIAMKHLEKVGANASYMAGGNIALSVMTLQFPMF